MPGTVDLGFAAEATPKRPEPCNPFTAEIGPQLTIPTTISGKLSKALKPGAACLL
jgi:hypothetical protein